MKKTTFLILIILFATQLINAQEFEWAHIYGEHSFSEVDVDQYNNIYTVSTGDTLTDFSLDNAGLLYGPTQECGAIYKFDPNGNVIWTKFITRLGGWGVVRPREVKCRGNYVYISGHIQNQSGTYDFDPGPNDALLTTTNSDEISFVLKLDLDGNYVWHNAVLRSYQFATRRSVLDDEDNLYVCGEFRYYIKNDSTINPYNGIAGGFVCKYDTTGQIKWLTHFDATISLHVFSIVINSANDLYIGGNFHDSLNIKINNTSLAEYYVADGSGYVVKLDSAGSVKWFKNFGNSNYHVLDMDIDSNDNLVLIGTNPMLSQVDLDPDSNSVYLLDSVSAVVAMWDSAANVLWGQGYRASYFIEGVNVSLNPSNQIAISGIMRGTCDFDLSVDSFNLATNYLTGVETFVLTLEPEGDFIWAGLLHNMEPSWNYSWGLKWIDNAIYVAGDLDDIVDFDPDSIDMHLLVSNAFPFGADYLLKLNTCAPSDSTIFADACYEYLWGQTNQLYTNSGIYYDTLFNSIGCDSIIRLNLTINEASESNDEIYTCEPYTWIDGNTYTSSNNTATDTLANSFGCDSIIHLNLVFFDSLTYFDEVIACDSFTWIDGITYTSSNNTAVYTMINADACDSIITMYLDLTILESTESFDEITTCDSYTWMDGVTYTSSNNTAIHTLPNAAGCDSIVHLNLTINESTNLYDQITVCDSTTWIDGNTYTSSNNTATYILTNAAGCDSIIHLDLTVNESTVMVDETTACDYYYWYDGISYTSNNNTATYTLTNSAGCDSVIYLDLTIIESTESYDQISVCDSYTWINGITYTSSNNTATYYLTNSVGCDSIIHLDLTINETTETYDQISACDSYTWMDGNTYTSSNNTATYTLNTAAGCDSIIHIDLTINESTVGYDAITACDSTTWIDGNTYTSNNNTATYTLSTTAGCDSVVHLNLIVNESSAGFDEITACGPYTWIDGNTYSSSNNTATYTSTNVAGCDSLITLNLNILPVFEVNLVDSACDEYWLNSVAYNTSGSYTQTLQSVDGCDSLINLDLTLILPPDPVIDLFNGNILTTELLLHTSYQWIDCATLNPVPNETLNTFTPMVGGDYAVIVSNECGIDTSDCFTLSDVSELYDHDISISPNPVKDILYIEKLRSNDKVRFYNVLGKEIYVSRISENPAMFSFNGFSKGIYFLSIRRNNQDRVFKVLKD